MAQRKPGRKKRGDAATGKQKFSKADLSFDFGFNVKPKASKARKRKPAGGGSV